MEFGKPLTDEELNQVLKEDARKRGEVFVPIEQMRKEKAERERAASVHKPKTKWQELTEEKLIHKIMNLHLHWFLFYPLIFWYLTKNEMHHAIRLHDWTLTEGAFMSGFKYVLIIPAIFWGLMIICMVVVPLVLIVMGIKEKVKFKEIVCICKESLLESFINKESLLVVIKVMKYPAWYIIAFAFLKYAVLPISDWKIKNPDALDIFFKVGMVFVVIHVLIAVVLKVMKAKKVD